MYITIVEIIYYSNFLQHTKSDENLSKKSNIVKYYYSYIQMLYISIYFCNFFIIFKKTKMLALMAKWNFQQC